MKKILMLIVIVLSISLVSLFTLPGCVAEEAPAEEEVAEEAPAEEEVAEEAPAEEEVAEEKIIIGLSSPNEAWTYHAIHTESVKKVVEAAGAELLVMDAGGDPNTQASLWDNLIAKKVDVIVSHLLDQKIMLPLLKKAKEEGIPVVITTVPPVGEAMDYVTSFCAYDHVDQGRRAAEALAAGLKSLGLDKAKIAIMEGVATDWGSVARVTGFKEQISESFPNIEIVTEQPADWAKDKGMALMEDWIVRYPDLNGVVASNDDMALGAAEAVKAAGKKGEIIIVGTDGQPAAYESIARGDMYGTVWESPSIEGPYSADLALKIAKGEAVPSGLWLYCATVTPDNVQKYLDYVNEVGW